jgi:hypothetical protein
MNLDDFFVVTAISNVCKYKRRYELYSRFESVVKSAGVNLITVELAFGRRPHIITEKGNPWHLQLRSEDEFWHKENLLNLGIAHGKKLNPSFKRVAWVDADCRPARMPRDWFEETWDQLDRYKFVQMWEHLIHIDHDYRHYDVPNPSFMYNYLKYDGNPYPPGMEQCGPYDNGEKPKKWGSPGLAWAANLSDLRAIGGIPDVAILGAGDWYLAHALTSHLELKQMERYSQGYRNYWMHLQTLCERWIKRDVGCVPGLVYHEKHGSVINRRYNTREQILIKNQYDPSVDIKYDEQGMIQLETWEPRQIKMYEQIRAYFNQRNEDARD